MSSSFEVLKELPTIDTKSICENMEEYARSYTINHKLKISDFCVSALICDSINYIGSDIDYNLKTSDLKDKYTKRKNKQIKPNTLLNILLKKYQAYYYAGIISEMEKRKENYFIPDEDNLDEEDSIDILIDYLNHIASVNDIDVIFTNDQITGIKRKRKCLTISPLLRNS